MKKSGFRLAGLSAAGWTVLALLGHAGHRGQESGLEAADKLFSRPYVDVDEWREEPVRHRFIHGGFQGTDARFSFCFPPKESYRGRFFHYIAPAPGSEHEGTKGRGPENRVLFAISNGAYFIQTNLGGLTPAGGDPSIGGYRVSAAAARYSREIAAKIYGPHRPYGYAFGGSGGAYRTIACAENTAGVWDGFVPFVPGSPAAIPNVFSVRMLALRKLRGKFPLIVDSLEPGGSGDPYAVLNPEERAALLEASRMGFPVRSWFNFETIGFGAFPILMDLVKQTDPSYFDKDFWSTPGYAGADPGSDVQRARFRGRVTISRILRREPSLQAGTGPADGVDTAWQRGREFPAGFEIEEALPPDAVPARARVDSGLASGAEFLALRAEGKRIWIDAGLAGFYGGQPLAARLGRVQAGDRLWIDNSDFLAAQYYHRHQVPSAEFAVWNQFRGPDGRPAAPQRPALLGPGFARSAGGSIQSGRIRGKMIVVAALWDQDAFPWQADWYAGRVREALGQRFDDSFRLYYVDRALHGDVESQQNPRQTVSYLGVLHQALLDVSDWVERGKAPPASTKYSVVDGQVLVPDSARERLGLQPVVRLTANGGRRAEVKAGEPVKLTAFVEVPPGAGSIIAAEWSFGDGSAYVSAPLGKPSPRVTVRTRHRFERPGTYFVTLRAIAHRRAERNAVFGRIQTLDRVRVVVH